jgi:hypothetical protein
VETIAQTAGIAVQEQLNDLIGELSSAASGLDGQLSSFSPRADIPVDINSIKIPTLTTPITLASLSVPTVSAPNLPSELIPAYFIPIIVEAIISKLQDIISTAAGNLVSSVSAASIIDSVSLLPSGASINSIASGASIESLIGTSLDLLPTGSPSGLVFDGITQQLRSLVQALIEFVEGILSQIASYIPQQLPEEPIEGMR